VVTEPLLRNRLQKPVILLLRACVLRVLPSNDRCLQSQRLVTGLYATIEIDIIVIVVAYVIVLFVLCILSLAVKLSP
jgi:hypothetical protein